MNDDTPQDFPELAQIKKDDARSLPPKELLMIVVMYIFTLGSAFTRGGKGVKSFIGIAPCSPEYWIFTLAFSIVCVAIITATTLMLINKFQRYKAAGYILESDDIRWDQQFCNTVTFVSLFTGLICGTLGLTGGVFLGPVLLALNVRTEVANATCSFVVSFSSSVAFVQYAAAGMVDYSYGVWYASWAGVGSLVGVAIIEKMMAKSGKASPAVFILALVLAMATVLIPIYGSLHVIDMINDGSFSFGFRNFC